MPRALYRKYRSRSLKDVVGQDHVVTTLTKALKSDRIRHAYLFSGPRGVGKTSVARILAHEVNKIPYKDDEMHLDIIEIDAASNRRIDEVRDLRDKVNIAPTSAKYKVYIIDEVHMLTREAFNALLKTLEEPPEHVIFILATTEAHKLPDTIISRTQHFTFKAVDGPPAVKQLAAIAKAEKIAVDDEALELLTVSGRGSFRDSISLLDQLSAHSDRVTVKSVRELIGAPPDELVDALVKATLIGDSQTILSALDDLNSHGANPALTAKFLGEKLRTALIKGQPVAVGLLKELIEVPASSDPYQSLELALLGAASRIKPSPAAAGESKETSTEAQAVIQPKLPAAEPAKALAKGKFSLNDWPEVLKQVKTESPALYTALRLAKPKLTQDNLLLAFEFPLHQKKVSTAGNFDTIRAVISRFGGQVQIETVVEKPQADSSRPPIDETPDDINNISNIFGNAEVLES